MNKQALVGIDIGGTKINIGKIVQGEIVQEVRIPTNPLRPEKEIIDDIIAGAKQLIDESVVGIGVGVPGLVDSNKGVVYNLTNIPSWKEVHLKEYLEVGLNLPVQVANDANCFALGEKIYGKGIGFKNVIGITLGTGLGTGVVIDNKVYSGKLSIAGELAGIPYLDSNYEEYCSSKFFKRHYNTTAKDVYDLTLDGNEASQKIFDEFGNHLGNLIRTIVLAYGPDAIIFGGAVSNSFCLFYPSIKKNLADFPHQNVLEDLQIFNFSSEKIPLMGAAALILDCVNENNLSEIISYEND